MDPDTITAVAAGLTLLSDGLTKGIATEIGKQVWNQAMAKLGWSSTPKASELAPRLAATLSERPEIQADLVALLRQAGVFATDVRPLVGSINAEKVIVASKVREIKM